MKESAKKSCFSSLKVYLISQKLLNRKNNKRILTKDTSHLIYNKQINQECNPTRVNRLTKLMILIWVIALEELMQADSLSLCNQIEMLKMHTALQSTCLNLKETFKTRF